MNQEVTAYIDAIEQEWQIGVCTRLRAIVHESVPQAEEINAYGKPHYRKDGKFACTYSAAKTWVSFTIFNGKAIDVPEGLFEPGNPERRTIKIRKGQDVDYDLLAGLLKEAAGSL